MEGVGRLKTVCYATHQCQPVRRSDRRNNSPAATPQLRCLHGLLVAAAIKVGQGGWGATQTLVAASCPFFPCLSRSIALPSIIPDRVCGPWRSNTRHNWLGLVRVQAACWPECLREASRACSAPTTQEQLSPVVVTPLPCSLSLLLLYFSSAPLPPSHQSPSHHIGQQLHFVHESCHPPTTTLTSFPVASRDTYPRCLAEQAT